MKFLVHQTTKIIIDTSL